MFTIVTHHIPDLDAIASVWMIKKFLPNWQDANVCYVPAGETLDKMTVDSDPHIMHVDTGFGFLDHHQTDSDTCAAKKTYRHIQKNVTKDEIWENEALERMADVVNFYDHFREVTIPDIKADYHVFDCINIIDGLKSLYPLDNQKITDTGFIIMDAIYKMMQEKIWAEEILEKEGREFMSIWGKAIAFETINDTVLKLAQKSGFVIAVRKDPKKKYVRIKGLPGTKVDLSRIYEEMMHKDPQATWYLHASKKLLLNGSTRNPSMKPTRLTLTEIINILKKP